MLNINYICPFRAIFKIWCPGCGGTRMVFSILDCDFYQAFRYNPLLFILLLLGIIFVIVELIYYIKKKSLIKIPVKVWIGLLIVVLIYMVLRNIPMFSYLIPTEV